MVHLLYFKNVTGFSLEPKLSLPLRFTNVRRPRVVQVSVCRNTRGDHLSFLREAGQLGPISTALGRTGAPIQGGVYHSDCSHSPAAKAQGDRQRGYNDTRTEEWLSLRALKQQT